ncbi:hypothetical protein [Marinactinospora rubrisoli]|uniref:Uncharacterized protein n=1 Tax=Marinactinospora rubrisoli TaxID=2715399 RepID=A0ABW2KGX6_9ACTN
MKAAAMGTAVADIVDWLASDRNAIDDVDAIGRVISTQVISELDAHVGTEQRDELRRALPGHFWCELLAQLCGAAAVADRTVEEIPTYAKSAGPGADEQLGWAALNHCVAGFALDTIWASVLPLVDNLAILRRSLRVLAVLICPDPGNHRAVAQLCVSPEARAIISDVAGSRILESFGPALDPISAG